MLGAEQALPQASRGATRIMRGGRAIACPIDDAFLLVIGAGGSMAGQAPAEINDDPAATLTASITSWRLTAPSASATHGFAALLPTNGTDRPLTAIRFGQERTGRRYIFSPRAVSVSDAAGVLAELAGGQPGGPIDSVVELLMKEPAGHRRLSALVTLLQSGHGSDGFIELLGENHDGAIFVRGWGRDVAPGVCRVMISGAKPTIFDCGIATFSRQDVPEGAAGFVGLLPASAPIKARDVEGLVYRGRGGWRYLKVHEQGLVAGPTETPGHIRSVLLKTHSSPQVLLRLRAAANSFDGKETISSLPLPVRMGIDHAFEVNGGGFLISGWLLDPDGHVQSVKLCRESAQARLDACWTRLERSDVTDAFTDEPMFRSALERGDQSHGFVVFVNGLGGDAVSSLHLELTLKDSRRAFMPLAPVRTPPRRGALRQIGTIAPADWALREIIERQIVPYLCASESLSPSVDATIDAGPFDRASGPPIIIAADGAGDEDIAPSLGLLALDPEIRRAPVALVMPADRFRRQADRIAGLAAFYRLSLRLMSVEVLGDVYDLLEAGARALTHDTVVLLAGSLSPLGSGWYGKLVAAHEKLEGSVISPTLAYEDHSVRWAGSWPADSCEYPLSGRYAGYPLSAVTGLKLTRVAAASFECCIMPRETLLQAGGFSGSYLGSQQKGLDLGLRLSRSGIESYWLPSVQMLGSDEASSLGTAEAAAIVERIDEQVFAARWAALPAGEENSVARTSA